MSRQRNLHLSIKQINQFLGTAQFVVSVTGGRHWEPSSHLSDRKTAKTEVINNKVDNKNERNLKLLTKFLHDRTKIIYQQKPKLGIR